MAKKKPAPDQQHFDGMEPPRIGPLTQAIKRAHEKGKLRAAAQDDENAARDTVVRLMHEHEQELLNPDSGKLVYTVEGITATITPGKEKLKVKVKEDDKENGDGTVFDADADDDDDD